MKRPIFLVLYGADTEEMPEDGDLLKVIDFDCGSGGRWFESTQLYQHKIKHLARKSHSPNLAVRYAIGAKEKAPVRWSILILRAKAIWLGDVEAASEAEAIKIGVEAVRAAERAVDGGEALAVLWGRTGGLIMQVDVRGVAASRGNQKSG